MLSSGIIACEKDHHHQVAIINAYRTDLYLAWTVETAYRISKRDDATLRIIDLSEACMDKQMSGLARIWRQLVRKRDSRELVRLFSQYAESVYTPTGIKLTIFIKNLFELFSIARDSTKLLGIESLKWKSVHSTFATEVATVEYSIRKNLFRLAVLATSFEQSYEATLRTIHKIECCSTLLGNSRLVNAAGCMAAVKELNLKNLVIERGARPGYLDTYKISPHSNAERRHHAILAWNALPENIAINNANSYLKLRQEYEPITGIKWNRNMETGLIPKLNPSKQTCVFYSSTEIEFAVFGDDTKSFQFKNQGEAVLALARNLDPEKWDLIIRRHPYRDKVYKKDPEARLWSEFVNYPNIKIIGPESKIDSYALAREANLVAHFNSSMGPEVIYMTCTPVITMGPTMWEEVDGTFNCQTELKLSEALKIDLPVRSISDVWVWANYWNKFGEEFAVVEWQPPKAFIANERILRR